MVEHPRFDASQRAFEAVECQDIVGERHVPWQSSEEGTVAWKWRQENPEADWPTFSSKELPARKPSHLPRQDNFCDCGLFTLTYAHYFAYASPSDIDPDKLQELGGEQSAVSKSRECASGAWNPSESLPPYFTASISKQARC